MVRARVLIGLVAAGLVISVVLELCSGRRDQPPIIVQLPQSEKEQSRTLEQGHGDPERAELVTDQQSTLDSLAIRYGRGDLTGTVVDEDDRPIEGAEVSLSCRAADSEDEEALEAALATRVSAEDGRFQWRGLPAAGTFFVNARAAGHAEQREPCRCQVAVGLIVDVGHIILRTEGRILGRVVDEDGTPVPGAEVRNWGSGSDGPRAVTDGDGRFVLAGLRADRYQLKVWREGFVPNLPPFPYHVLATGETWDNVEIVLTRGRVLRGTVLDSDGLPVAGGRLMTSVGFYEFNPDETTLGGQVVIDRTDSNEQGDFTLLAASSGLENMAYLAEEGWKPSRNHLSITAEGFERWSQQLELPPGHDNVELAAIKLTRAAEFIRVVIAPVDQQTGKPVAPDWITPGFLHQNGRRGWMGRRGPDDWTIEEGRYILRLALASASEPVDVQVDAPGYLRAKLVRLRADAGPIVVPMIRGGVIDGHVTEADGSPVANARVSLKRFVAGVTPDTRVPTNRSRFNEVVATDTKSGGLFRFDGLKSGRYALRVSRLDRAPVWSEVLAVGPGQDRLGIELLLAEPAASITGIVTGLDGAPAPGIGVVAFREDGTSVAVTSDGAGAFRFAPLAPGRHSVHVYGYDERRPSFGHTQASPLITVQVEAGEEHRFNLDLRESHLSAISGEILINGEAAYDLTILCLADRSQRHRVETSTDHEGRFESPPHSSGPVAVWVRGQDGILARRDIVLQPGRLHRVDFDLRTASLKVTILDGTTGEPSHPCEIDVDRPTDVEEDDPYYGWQDRHVGRDGVARFERLLPGTYLVRANSPVGDGLCADAAFVHLRKGDAAEIILHRQPFGSLQVRCDGDARIDGFELRRADGWRPRVHITRSKDGSWKLYRLPPGPFRLVAFGDDGDQVIAEVDVIVQPGESRSVHLPTE